MSKTIEERDKIRKYLLKHIGNNDASMVAKAMDTFSVSKTTVYKYLRQLEEEGTIMKTSGNTCKYILQRRLTQFYYSPKDGLDEDVIFRRDISPLLDGLPKNVLEIWRYAFTEMMNNAIEHSRSETIRCLVSRDYINTMIFIVDDGIGVFNNIRNFFKETYNQDLSIDDAIMQLTAGKLTTAKEGHSGEGIFFTSRALDKFQIIRFLLTTILPKHHLTLSPESLTMRKARWFIWNFLIHPAVNLMKYLIDFPTRQ